MGEQDGTTNLKPARDQEHQEPGDRIAVGSVGDRAAVALGRGARAFTRILNIDIRLLPVVVLLVAIVGVLAYLLLRPQAPTEMTGEFNVAVAEFTVVDQAGSRIRSEDGRALADFLFRRLEAHFAELDLQTINYVLWPAAYTGRVEGNTREERERAAELLAERIGAHVIIYGVITQSGDRSTFAPEFYVDYRGFEDSQEVTGQHELGSALRVVLPFDAKRFQDVENPALSARANALSRIAVGLSYYSIDDFEAALDHFQDAEATKGWLQGAGKEVVHILLGNANVRWASQEKSAERSAECLPAAMAHYDTALTINPSYARAMVGRASVLYLEALGDPENPLLDDVDQERLDEAVAAYEVALGLGDAPESANIETKVHFGLGQIHYIRGLTVGGDWMAQAEAEFEWVVRDYEDGNVRVANLAGHAHHWLALIAHRQNNIDAAVEHYMQAVELVTPFYQVYYYTCLGEIYRGAGQVEQAVEAYEEAIATAEFYGFEESAERYAARLSELRAEE